MTSRLQSAGLFLALCKEHTYRDDVKIREFMERVLNDLGTGRHQRIEHKCAAKPHLRASHADEPVSHQGS